jgi:predicted  nucleic acid-binding Zn-ribbon protein
MWQQYDCLDLAKCAQFFECIRLTAAASINDEICKGCISKLSPSAFDLWNEKPLRP